MRVAPSGADRIQVSSADVTSAEQSEAIPAGTPMLAGAVVVGGDVGAVVVDGGGISEVRVGAGETVGVAVVVGTAVGVLVR
jgi:hypothetical protein